jgi:ferric-dicitrate binding protein FerR (iron transport regulator)
LSSSLTAEPSHASTLRCFRLFGLDDFEVWRRRVTGLLIFTSALLVAYWAAWFADRGVVASDHTAEYVAFEQSFPLADAWLLGADLLAAIQLWRRRSSALVWLLVLGGAGVYLCALDVLYDLEHGIYTKGQGGAIELTINLLTAVLSIGLLASAWRFRRELLGSSTGH